MDRINSFVPLYYQLKKIIIDMIENEEIKPDETIPSEPKLMTIYDLSRTTVRKAIDELVNEGYLYKIQGKGTFVKGRGFEQALIKLSGCSEDIKRLGLTPRPKVLQSSIITPSKRIAHLLGILEGESTFFMERIVYGDNLPINKNKSYIPYKYVNAIFNSYQLVRTTLRQHNTFCDRRINQSYLGGI
ncbi:MAG: GntR family transcriptional regulator [Cellulosilyticaceae bacterium]